MVAPLRRLIRAKGRTPEDIIASAAAALGRPPRILDFGVGFGRLAIPRILAGHDIYGVDVDEGALERGRQALSDAGLEPDRFRLLRDGRSSFPDGQFDVVYSEDVLEHVRDGKLEQFVVEARRVTAPGGFGLHSYPGRYRVVEGHLHMPLLQWLPRNAILRWAILAYTIAGVEPDPAVLGIPEVTGLGRRARAQVYHRWLMTETFYRSRSEVHGAFRSAGFVLSSPRSRILSALTHEYVVTRPSA